MASCSGVAFTVPSASVSVARQVALGEAEARDVVDRRVSRPIARSRRMETRLRERYSASRSARRAAELSRRRSSGATMVSPSSTHDRRVEDHGRRREAILQRRRIQERLEARARLTPRLRDAVVLVGEVIEAADERDDAAVVRVQRDQRALRLGQLRRAARCPCRPSRRRRRRPAP